MLKLFKYLLRIFLFGIVVYILSGSISIGQMQSAFLQVSLIWTIPAILFYLTRYIIQAGRWYVSARAHEQRISFAVCVRAQFEIAFLEILFPLPDSEDGLKLAYMSQKKIDLGAGAAIILYDRMIGLSILLMLIPFAFFLFAQKILPDFIISLWFQCIVLLLVLPLITFHRKLIRLILKIMQNHFPMIVPKNSLLENELKKNINLSAIIVSLLLTILQALCGACTIGLLVNAFSIKVSFLYLIAGIPLYQLSSIIPLSIQGLGLYETAIVYVLQQLHINSGVALMIGLIHFSFHVFSILLAGLLYLFNKDKAVIEDTFLKWGAKLIKG